jgi:CheY-like chemotaxis protein
MSQTTILIIDDSATIRRLVDTQLSQAGYRVILGPNAEDGLRLAEEERPDLILLDHQLPGTTGAQVCEQLLESPELRLIPVVVSSTLRKKAYIEYTDMSNVVDMLPKPYAPELLLTTVANALETGKLIVASQADGTAVPETIGDPEDTTLAGSFAVFGLREVLDFLNNGNKSGMLEVETARNRVSFYVDRGRLQAVTSTGVDAEEIIATLPEALRDLAPVVNLTVGGRFCAEVEGLVQLLDKKVLDQRLLRKLLRHQAALLARRCFRMPLKSFRFEGKATIPPLFRKLPLDISLVALTVDGALHCDASELPEETAQTVYVRSAVRGQNLDRAGLAAHHMKVLGQLAEPTSSRDLATRLGLPHDEVRRVAHGMVLAELVECTEQAATQTVFALEHDPGAAQLLRSMLTGGSERYSGRVVRDQLGLQLLLKRSKPDAVVMAVDNDDFRELAARLRANEHLDLGGVRWVAITDDAANKLKGFDAVLHRPYKKEDIEEALDSLKYTTVKEELCGASA